MTGRNKSSGAISATELMAKLHNDPDYQRKSRADEGERQVRVQDLRNAEQSIITDLREAKVGVLSVWDLVNTAQPYPTALPILLGNLQQGGYPDRVMESLGRALAVKPAVVCWDQLKALYLVPRNAGEEDGLAVALAACATDEQLDDLIGFLSLADRGESRIYFLRPILHVGGQRGRDVVESLRSDPVFGKEAQALLRS